MLKIVLLPGDGVGPECVAQAKKVLDAINSKTKNISFVSALIGGCAIDATGVPLPAETLAECKTADAILLGAVGGPKWTNPRPEQGLLEIRKGLGLYCNIRPCFFPGKSLVDYSPLKSEIVDGVSFTVVRELTGGIYFGDRKEGDVATDEMKYTRPEVERITRVAGQLAMQSNPPLRVTSVDKANVLATSRLWRKVVDEIMTKEFPQVEYCHALVDSTAMLMVKDPKKLNGVVLTENMFGDILSDEASVIPGSLGLLGSASVAGLAGAKGGIFEPIHGSAPDIAGKGKLIITRNLQSYWNYP